MSPLGSRHGGQKESHVIRILGGGGGEVYIFERCSKRKEIGAEITSASRVHL